MHVLDTGGRLHPSQVAVGHLSLTVIVTKSSYDFKNGGWRKLLSSDTQKVKNTTSGDCIAS